MLAFLRPRRVAALAAAACLAASGAAYGYWTTTGAGTGTATVASASGTVVLHGVAAAALVPGGTATVSFTADNSGPASLYVTRIHLEGVSADAAHAACTVADFGMPDVISNTRVPAGSSAQALAGSGTLSMADTGVSQDACKGATLTLALTSS
ncbi:MAG TPA: hypothetical protein VGI72_07955 [Gaiellales bacterium]|jgi:hypothetical protein